MNTSAQYPFKALVISPDPSLHVTYVIRHGSKPEIRFQFTAAYAESMLFHYSTSDYSAGYGVVRKGLNGWGAEINYPHERNASVVPALLDRVDLNEVHGKIYRPLPAEPTELTTAHRATVRLRYYKTRVSTFCDVVCPIFPASTFMLTNGDWSCYTHTDDQKALVKLIEKDCKKPEVAKFLGLDK